MNNPNWAEILSANAALWAAIASVIATLTTLAGVIVATYALRWARKAAQEAGRQAEASIKGLELARQAAKSAEDQVKLLEQQIAFSEPQPILFLTFAYQSGASNSQVQAEIINVGEEIAFDVEFSDLTTQRNAPDRPKYTLKFGRKAYLRAGAPPQISHWIEPPMPTSAGSGHINQSPTRPFMDRLIQDVSINASEKGSKQDKELPVSNILVKYRSARGRQFSQNFVLTYYPSGLLNSQPEGSLVRETLINPWASLR